HLEHRIREEPEVVSRHGAFVTGVPARERERGFARLRDAELHYGKALELDGVLPVVERRGEARMHVWDVKALEVVVDVERPVRVHEVVPCAQDVERELRERKLMEPSDKWREDRGDRHLRARCQRDEQEALPKPKPALSQTVRLPR